MRSKFLLTLILTMLSLTAVAQQKGFIGFRHKGVVYGETLSNGVKDLGGGLLSNENYGVSQYSKGNKHYLWLEKITSRDTNGVPSWVVRDFLEFPTLKKNQAFYFSYSSKCRQNGKEKLDLIVMVESNPRTKTSRVLKAWKANVKTEKFEKIPTKGINCAYGTP